MKLGPYITKFGELLRARGVGAFTVVGHALFSRVRAPYTNTVLKVAEFLLAPCRTHETLTDPLHGVYREYVNMVNGLGHARVLEVGSRNVTGVNCRDHFQGCAEYLGFDVLEGPNVDMVGDVHEIGSLLPHGYFDGVSSLAVFEHLAMPWKAVTEINKIMKDGGLFFALTHPAWPPHELPWDFWRYGPETFKVLLNEKTGFEILHCHQGGPGRIVSLSTEKITRKTHLTEVNQFIVVLARKIGPPSPDLSWGGAASEFIPTRYPNKPT